VAISVCYDDSRINIARKFVLIAVPTASKKRPRKSTGVEVTKFYFIVLNSLISSLTRSNAVDWTCSAKALNAGG